MDPNVQLTKTKDGETTNHPFKELLGYLQYLALSTRPDICAAVSALSKFQTKLSDAHWSGLKRIQRYLRGTMETKLVYTKGVENPVLLGYADADFANDIDDRKSISGHAFKVFGNLVSWSTKR
ncbi:uncharacterized protein LOC129760625 [Uranotaenia lowii]|uniref:uncharacterized protein LOC129760625 n=1 Tax=Uranotaenia lowii TaxID=190385 RepID=UPI0024798058|nr:uncharacterized protein LOC129760625 [Uranotaenia lowii]